MPLATGSSKTSDVIDRTTTLFNSFIPAFASHYVQGTGNTVTLADAFFATPGAAVYSASGLGLSDQQINSDTVGRAVTRAEGVVLAIKADLTDSLKVVSTSGYDSGLYSQLDNTDCDATPLRLCSVGYQSKFHAFNQDLRFDYANGPFKLIVGGFVGIDSLTSDNRPDFFNALSLFNIGAAGLSPTYFNPAGFFSPFLAANSLPTGITATQHFKQERTSLALYGEGSYALTNTIKLTLGGRLTKDTTKFKDGLTTFYDDAGAPRLLSVSGNAGGAPFFLSPVYQEDGVTVAIPQSAGPVPGGLNQEGKSTRFSGRAILDWKPVDNVMFYGSYSRGYRAGTYNGLAYGKVSQVYFVPPETVNAFEVGFKTRFFDNRVQLNGAFFLYDYKGQQGQVVDATATANLVALDGIMKGFEAELQIAATDRLTLGASIGILDSHYKNGTNCSSYLQSDPRQQVGNCVHAGSGWTDVGGNPFPFAAKTSLNFNADWTAVDYGKDKVVFHADASYTGNFHYDSFGDYSAVPLYQLTVPIGGVTAVPLVGGKFTQGGGDFWMANARATFTHGNYSIALWAKNIFDKTTYPYGIATENLFGNDYRVRNQPRTYGVEATMKF